MSLTHPDIIGRSEEIEILRETLNSKKPGLLAIYGRRRVGKTFLIHTYFSSHLVFELTGMYGGTLKEQLLQFAKALQLASESALTLNPPKSWVEAFHALEKFLEVKVSKKKRVVFLDEFPWLDGRKSGFLSAFEHFWNTWASRQSNVLVIVCGSAASWMIRNIVNNKGGLHNRITQKIRLLPFSLSETETYLRNLGTNLDRYQILQLYMALGGIPQYLNNAEKGTSAAQIIEKTCFTKDGLLTGEFNNLYNSLFEISDSHLKIVKTLASARSGMTRQEIIESCGLKSGGSTSLVFSELEECGFIKSSLPFEKTARDGIYRLIDEFSIFYLRFMANSKSTGKNVWLKASSSSAYLIWGGMAFESVCLKHIQEIKKALGLESIETEESTWRFVPTKNGNEPGAQIDLLIDRKDHNINLCEIKFYSDEFSIDKSYEKTLQHKIDVFKARTKTRKTVFLTMITTFGVKENTYSSRLVQKNLTMEALFD